MRHDWYTACGHNVYQLFKRTCGPAGDLHGNRHLPAFSATDRVLVLFGGKPRTGTGRLSRKWFMPAFTISDGLPNLRECGRGATQCHCQPSGHLCNLFARTHRLSNFAILWRYNFPNPLGDGQRKRHLPTRCRCGPDGDELRGDAQFPGHRTRPMSNRCSSGGRGLWCVFQSLVGDTHCRSHGKRNLRHGCCGLFKLCCCFCGDAYLHLR